MSSKYWVLRRDGDGHWYQFPEEDILDFEYLLNNNFRDEFRVRFEKYQINGIENVRCYPPGEGQ